MLFPAETNPLELPPYWYGQIIRYLGPHYPSLFGQAGQKKGKEPGRLGDSVSIGGAGPTVYRAITGPEQEDSNPLIHASAFHRIGTGVPTVYRAKNE